MCMLVHMIVSCTALSIMYFLHKFQHSVSPATALFKRELNGGFPPKFKSKMRMACIMGVYGQRTPHKNTDRAVAKHLEAVVSWPPHMLLDCADSHERSDHLLKDEYPLDALHTKTLVDVTIDEEIVHYHTIRSGARQIPPDGRVFPKTLPLSAAVIGLAQMFLSKVEQSERAGEMSMLEITHKLQLLVYRRGMFDLSRPHR